MAGDSAGIPDTRLLLPSLLVRRKRPVNLVKIDWSKPATRGLLRFHIPGLYESPRDLVSGASTDPVGIGGGATPTRKDGNFLFDGTYAFIETITESEADFLSDMSVVCRAKVTSYAAGEAIASWWHDAGGGLYKGWSIHVDPTGNKWRWEINTTDGQFFVNSTYDINQIHGEWHHLTLTFQTPTMRLYADATPINTNTGALGAFYASNNSIRIGLRDDGIADGFNGQIDFIMIFNRELNPGEIASLYYDPYQFLVPA